MEAQPNQWGIAEQGIRKAEFVRGSEIGASVKMIIVHVA
jgi:hypothetical protein